MKIFHSLFKDTKGLLFFICFIAFLLSVPSLFNGFVLDDYYHRLVMSNTMYSNLLVETDYSWGLFSFLQGDSEKNSILVSKGVLPWWVFPEIKYTFFRPLSELSIAIDYFLWANNPVAMHLQNTFWFVLCVFSAGLFLFKNAPKNVAILSLIFFLLEGSHGFAISWLASRNAMIACAMSFFSLYYLSAFFQDKNIKFYIVTMVFHIMALLAGEIGITSAAFLSLYIIIFPKDSFIKKFKLCIPIIAITFFWVGLRSVLEYGAYGTGAYIDPFKYPGEFITSVIDQVPLIFFSLCVGLPVEVATYFLNASTFVNHASYLILSIFLLILLLPLYLKNKRAYFYLFSGLAACVPVLAGGLQSRVLFIVSFPVLCFVAECLVSFWEIQKIEDKPLFKKIFLNGPWYFSMYCLGFLAL